MKDCSTRFGNTSKVVALAAALVGAVSAFGMSGVVDASGRVSRNAKYTTVKAFEAPMKTGGLYRIKAELKADAMGWAVVGVNDLVKGKKHFYRLCPVEVGKDWSSFSADIFVPETGVEVLDDGTAPILVGWESNSDIRRLEYRNLAVEEIPMPRGSRAPDCWERPGKNGFFNSSFELGLASHDVRAGLSYVRQAPQPVVSVDETVAWHGKRSLKIDNTTLGRTVEFTSSAGSCDPQVARVTVSCYVRADRPVEARLVLRDILYDAVRCRQDWGAASAKVKIGNDWTRVSVSVSPRGRHGKFAASLSFENRAVVWVDALQVESGSKPTDYEPAAPVEVALTADSDLYVLDQAGAGADGPRTKANVRAVNYGTAPERVSVRTDFGEVELEVPGGDCREAAQSFVPSRYGAFTAGGTFDCSAGRGTAFPFDYAVVGPQAPWRGGFALGLNGASGADIEGQWEGVPFANWRTSFGFSGGQDLDGYYRRLALSGCRIVRLHDCDIWWFNLEPKKGEFHWEILDTVVDSCERNGIAVMLVFGNGAVTSRRANAPDKLADWFVRMRSTPRPSGWGSKHQCYLPDPGDWRDFYTAVVRRYRGRIRYYEVVNEPNGTMADPDDYMRYLKLSYEIVRANDPAAKVVGICSTGDYGADTAKFVEEIGERGGFALFDVMSFHPYGGRLDVTRPDAEGQLAQIRRLVDRFAPGKPVIQDEIYYLSTAPEHAIFGRPRDDPGLGEDWPDGHLIRRAVMDLAGGVTASVSITARQLHRVGPAHRGSHPHRSNLTGWNANGRFVAVNAFARFLNDATFVGKPDFGQDVNAFDFQDRDGKAVRVLWMRKTDVGRNLEMPTGRRAFDLYGNEIAGESLALTSEPVYVR